jgi:hypothetical protein
MVFISNVKTIGHQWALNQRGIVTDGTVTAAGMERAARGPIPEVSYVFEYAGVRYHGKRPVYGGWMRTISAPYPIRVRFLPDLPEISCVEDVDIGAPIWMNVVGAIILFGFAGSFALFALLPLSDPLNRWFDRKMLQRRGEP